MKKVLLLLLLLVLTGCSEQVYQEYTEIEQQGYLKISLNQYELTPECKELGEKIISLLKESDYCTTGLDCKIIYLNCPFGCYNLVNKNIGVSEIELLSEKFDKECRTCKYDCSPPPTQDTIICKEGKCGAIRIFYI